MPYVPNARYDRTKNSNEIFTLKYFCEFINSLKFDRVYIEDPHSNVTLALLNNTINTKYIASLQYEIDVPDVVIFPDEGALKRYSNEIHSYFESDIKIAYGMKNRDWETGKIKGLELYGDKIEENDYVLIIDDICSYGGTFYFLSKIHCR